MKRKIALFLITVLMTMSLAACGNSAQSKENAAGGSENSQTEAAVNETEAKQQGETAQEETGEAKSGGVLRIATKAKLIILGLPGAVQNSHSWIFGQPAIESLGRRDADGNVQPWLADKIVLDEEAKTINITLKENIFFHDGTPFNAEAVTRNYDINQEYNCAFVADLDHAEAISDNEVVLHLNNLNGYTVLSLVVDGGRMVSPSYYDEVGYDALKYDVCGTGPFKLVSADEALIKYEKNEDYWQEGMPYLDGIEIICCSDETTAMTILRSGEADAIYVPTTEDASALLAEGGYLNIGSGNAYYSSALEINFKSTDENTPMSKKEVRQAFCYAIDKETIVEALGFGFYKPTNQLALEGSDDYSDKVVGYDYDPDKARELLVSAGYADGCTIDLNYQAATEKIAVMMQGYLEEAGFIVNMKIMESPVWTEAVTRGGSTTFNDAIVAYIPFNAVSQTGSFGSNPTQNTHVWDPAKLETVSGYFNIMLNSLDADEVSEAKDNFQTYIIDEECLLMPVYGYYSQMITKENVHELNFFEEHTMFWTPEKAWIE